jgi:hypothetical protein
MMDLWDALSVIVWPMNWFWWWVLGAVWLSMALFLVPVLGPSAWLLVVFVVGGLIVSAHDLRMKSAEE